MSSFQVTVDVVDSSDLSKVFGAKVWLDGVPVSPNSSAIFAGSVNSSAAEVWGCAGADGYTSKSFKINPGANLVPISKVAVKSCTAVITTSTQPVSGVTVEITGPVAKSAVTANGTVDVPGLPYGDYHLTATHEDYEDIAQDFSLPANTNIELKLVALTDDGEEGAPEGSMAKFSTTVTATQDENFDITAALAGPPKMDAETFEAIYGNAAFEGYFTSAQARVYVGKLFVDEMQSIQYQVQTNVVPVYGYASRFADAWGEGKSLVQGQLVINYISEAYMFTLLDEYQNGAGNSTTNTLTADEANGKDLAAVLAARKSAYVRTGAIPLLEDQIKALASTPAAVRAAKQALRDVGFDPVYMNAAYLRIPFDMTIEIGTGEHRTYRKLESCRIVSNEQILDQSGQIIGDAYGFVARRLR
jgi:hypothetical protein